MVDLPNMDDECSSAWRRSIDNIDEWGLLYYEPNQRDNIEEDTDPIDEEDNVEEVESDDIYVGRTLVM